MRLKNITKDIKYFFTSWIGFYVLILIVSGLSSFVVQMIATGLPLYCVDIGKTTAQSGIFAGFYSAALIISRPFVGKWTDEKGKWNISIVGMILFFASIAGMVFVPFIPAFSVYQAIEGFAFSALSTALAALTVDILPPETIKKGIALFTVTKSLTISLGASFAVSYAEKFGSDKIFVCAFVNVLVALVLNVILKRKPTTEKVVENKTKPQQIEYKGIDKYIDLSALPICLIQFVFTFSLTLGTCYLPSYAKTIGLEGIGIYYTVSAITMLLSQTVFTKYLNKLNSKYSFLVGMFLAAITTIMVLFGSSVRYFVLLSIPNAIGICLINPMLNVKATASVPENRRGVASSTYYASLDLGSGAGSMIWGILVPYIGYKVSFIVATILLVIAYLYGAKRVKD